MPGDNCSGSWTFLPSFFSIDLFFKLLIYYELLVAYWAMSSVGEVDLDASDKGTFVEEGEDV